MNHAERDHAKYNPSGAFRWFVCHGQPNLAETVPEQPSSIWAIEGTRAHEYLDQKLHGHDAVATPEIVASAGAVLEYIDDLRQQFPDLAVVHETRVYMPQDVVTPFDCSGTLDIFCHSAVAKRAWVIDFKHGAGEAVEVAGNKQLLMYASGVLMSGVAWSHATLAIIQPRAFHHDGAIREWQIDADTLLEFVSDLHNVLTHASQPDASLTPGTHCKWCDAALVCPAIEKRALALAHENFKGVRDIDAKLLPSPAEIPMDRIGTILENADVLETWLQAVRDYAFSQAKSGVAIPGHKLVEATARRQWTADMQKVAAGIMQISGFELHADDIMPRKLAGITEMENALVKIATRDLTGADKKAATERVKTAMAFLTTKESSGNLKLVPIGNSRPATSTAAKAFAGVTIEPVTVPALPAPAHLAGAVFVEPDPQALIQKG